MTNSSVKGNRSYRAGAAAKFFIFCITAMPSSCICAPLNTAEENSPQWRIVRMRVTAYCPCTQCCGPSAQGRTANGHVIRPGDRFVAAAQTYSFGTELIVPQYNGTRPIKVLDRGGAIQGNHLDLFFASHAQAAKWGVRYLDVKIRLNRQQET